MKWSSPDTLMIIVALLGMIILLIAGFYLYKKTNKRIEDLEKQNPSIHAEILKIQQTVKTQEQMTINYFRTADAKMDERFNQLIAALKAKDGDFSLPEPPRRVSFAPEYHQPPQYGNYWQPPPPPQMSYHPAVPYGQMGYHPAAPPAPYGQDASSLLAGL